MNDAPTPADVNAPRMPADVRMYRQDRAPWGALDILIVIFIVMVALVAIFTALSFLLNALGISSDVESNPAGARALLLGQMVLDIVAVGAAAGFSIAKYRLPWRAWGVVRPPNLHIGLIFGVLALAYGALLAYRAATILLGLDALVPQSNLPEALFNQASVLPVTLFLVLVIAPIFEELFFRGFLFHGFWGRFTAWRLARGDTSERAARVGFWCGALLSGFTFSLIHVQSVETIALILPFGIIGTLFAWIVRRTGSIWNAVAVHFLFNAIGVAGNLAQVILT